MTIVEMLEQSGVLTLLGMGIVFSFLLILIITVTVSGKVIHALGLDKDLRAPKAVRASTAPASAGGEAAVTAAISAAVQNYRKNH
jgi:oxaloacetate decarboxylase gamma subunit